MQNYNVYIPSSGVGYEAKIELSGLAFVPAFYDYSYLNTQLGMVYDKFEKYRIASNMNYDFRNNKVNNDYGQEVGKIITIKPADYKPRFFSKEHK